MFRGLSHNGKRSKQITQEDRWLPIHILNNLVHGEQLVSLTLSNLVHGVQSNYCTLSSLVDGERHMKGTPVLGLRRSTEMEHSLPPAELRPSTLRFMAAVEEAVEAVEVMTMVRTMAAAAGEAE